MNSKNIFSVFFLTLLVFFVSSCKKEESSSLSNEDIQKSFLAASDDYYYNSNSYVNTQGSEAESQLDDITTLPLMYFPDFFSNAYFLPTSYFENNFNFNNNIGTWNFQGLYSQWSHQSTPNDKILIKFPFPFDYLEQNPNNATLTISDYTTATINQSNCLTGLKANITVNSTVIWSNEYIASYPSTNEKTVKTIKKVGQFIKTRERKFSVNGEITTINNEFKFQKDNSTILFISSSKIIDETTEPKTASVEAKTIIKNIEFCISLSFNYSDFQNSSIDLNNVIKIEAFNLENTKLADLIFKKNGSHWDLWIKYADGNEVLSEEYLQEFDEFLNNFSKGLFSFEE